MHRLAVVMQSYNILIISVCFRNCRPINVLRRPINKKQKLLRLFALLWTKTSLQRRTALAPEAGADVHARNLAHTGGVTRGLRGDDRPGSVAPLGWVTPGAATGGGTPLFFLEKNLATFFYSPVLRCQPISSSQKLSTFFAHRFIAFYCFHSGVTPPSRVSPYTFLPVRPRFSTILCKFAHKKLFFLWMSPPWRASPGAVRPLAPLVTPLIPGGKKEKNYYWNTTFKVLLQSAN